MSADQLDAAALLAPLASAQGILLAVSGGPDSVALMLLAAEWRSRGRTPPIAVATIDHGLRPESGPEAAAAGAQAQALGFGHTILRWEGHKPATGIQDAARDARYQLLLAQAEKSAADRLVTAHHADDQAETVLFRLTRGSGMAGLSGMAPAAHRGSIQLVRPLLGVPKAALVALCVARGQRFASDPTNTDHRYARPRLRALSATLTAQGLDGGALRRLGQRAARAEEALAWASQRAGASWQAQRGPGTFAADAQVLLRLPEELARRLLADEIGRLGTGAPPRLSQLERLAKGLREALGTHGAFHATLGGAALHLTPSGWLTIGAMPPRRAPTPAAPRAPPPDAEAEF